MVFFIVHQLYKCTYSIMYDVCLPYFNSLFPIHVNEMASIDDDQNNFSFKKTKGYYIH